MTTYQRSGPAASSRFRGFHHISIWCSNAYALASFYELRMGFRQVAYRGLETGSREISTRVLRQGDIFIALSSPLNPTDSEMGRRIALKGDAVKDIAFRVDDCRGIYERAIRNGAKGVVEPTELKDEEGSVVVATIQTYGDTSHTLVECGGYRGVFLPGYKPVHRADPLNDSLPPVGLGFIDHCVGNQPDNEMVKVSEWYEKSLEFHRFWSVDDSQIHSEWSALRSIVMTDWDESIKMPINEPANGKKKSQIQEYVEYHGGAGVQHVALNTKDILKSLTALRARGMEFLSVPATYYEDVRKRLAKSSVKVQESIDELQKLNILIDFDDKGYLLQIFSKPVEDRPTLFYEIIQRHNHEGFGAGNFKALFEAIEREQELRGNLNN